MNTIINKIKINIDNDVVKYEDNIKYDFSNYDDLLNKLENK